MNYLDMLPLASFLFCAGIYLAVILRRQWNLTALAFCLGMASLALMEFSNFMALSAIAFEKILLWKRLSLLGEVLFVGNLLLFSVVFAKKDTKAAIRRWRWGLPFAYVLPGALLILLFTMNQAMTTEGFQIIRLWPIAKYFHISLMIIVIFILRNLENTFRSYSGLERGRIKFMIFGVGSMLSIYVYVLSQRLLYNVIDVGNIYVM